MSSPQHFFFGGKGREHLIPIIQCQGTDACMCIPDCVLLAVGNLCNDANCQLSASRLPPARQVQGHYLTNHEAAVETTLRPSEGT